MGDESGATIPQELGGSTEIDRHRIHLERPIKETGGMYFAVFETPDRTAGWHVGQVRYVSRIL